METWSVFVHPGEAGKIRVDWRGLVQGDINEHFTKTKTEIEQMLTKSGEPSFWGKNWEGTAGEKNIMRIRRHLGKGRPFVFNKRGDSIPANTSPSRVKFLPALVGIKQKRLLEDAAAVFRVAVQDGDSALENWAHEKEHEPFMKKIVFKVHSNTLTYSHLTHTHMYTHTHTHTH